MSLSIHKYSMYVGTYTHGKSKGIYIFDFDAVSGELELKGSSSELENPSYLCISKDNRYLYAVMEVHGFNGQPGGAVCAYAIKRETGLLEFINMQPAKGTHPCHLCTDSAGNYLFTANYGDGTITVYPLGKDGRIGAMASLIRHRGHGPDKSRQEGPHAHYVTLTPEEKYLCAVDLGIDRINLYAFDQANGLSMDTTKAVHLGPGSGPRHMTFSPNKEFAYVLTELSSEVIVLEYHSLTGAFNEIQRISTLPADFNGPNFCAAIHISSCGNFLYGSNRGHDSLAIFKADPVSGRLEKLAHTPSGGIYPRDFAIAPTGRFLFAANQDSDRIVQFTATPDSGKLEPTGKVIEIPNPTCIKFGLL